MVKRERSLGSAVRAMRVAVNSLGACEATGFRTWTGEVSVQSTSLSSGTHRSPKLGPPSIRRVKSRECCERLGRATRARHSQRASAAGVEQRGRNC